MNFTKQFVTRLVQCCALMSLAAFATTSLSATGVEAGWVTTRFVHGHPEYQKAGTATWTKLDQGMVLHAGDSIRCNHGSHADLMLGYNNGNIQVSPDSEVLLDKLTYTHTGLEIIHDTQLSLKKGLLYGQVDKMANESKYQVKTPKGVAGIRGTRYRIADNGDVTVSEGTVLVSVILADGTTKVYTVAAGNTFDYATGTVRTATPAEIVVVNDTTVDSETHGGAQNNIDPASHKFFQDTGTEIFVSPTTSK